MSTPRKAREVACEWHGSQRYGHHPYVKHLDDVAAICRSHSATAEIVAYLHDILEDTKLSAHQLEDIFGRDVRELVEVLTDPPGANRKERKAAAYANLADIGDQSPLAVALVVKAADRLANVRACVEDGNDGLLEMYRKEHSAFVRAVRRVGWNEGTVAATTMLLTMVTGSDAPEAKR